MKKLLAIALLSSNLLGLPIAQSQTVSSLPYRVERKPIQEKQALTVVEAVALKVYYQEKMYTVFIDGSGNFDMVASDDNFKNGQVYNISLNEKNEVYNIKLNDSQEKFDTEHLMYDHKLIYSIIDSANMKQVDILGDWNNQQTNVLSEI